MSLTLDPEIVAALASMAESGVAPPAVGDIAAAPCGSLLGEGVRSSQDVLGAR